MSDHHHHRLTKKERKKEQQKKNRFHQELFQWLRLRRAEDERVKEQEKERTKPSRESAKKDDEVWSAKVSTIRNRLDGQRRDSKERWNRFSGTSSAGGRGL